MNLRKLSVIGLSACALLFSCNKETKLSVDDAKKYVEENYKLTQAPTVTSANLSWDFKDSDETVAKGIYQSNLAPVLKETKEYTVSGSGEAKLSVAQDYSELRYVNATRFNQMIQGGTDGMTFYKNNTGLRITITSETSGAKSSANYQWNKTGGIAKTTDEYSGEQSGMKVNMVYSITFNY